jgi:hypothetical protein
MMQMSRPQSRYKFFFKMMMALSFFIPTAGMFIALPYEALLLTWFGLSFFGGLLQGNGQNFREVFGAGMMTLAASVIGVAVGTAALIGAVALFTFTSAAMLVTAPTVIAPILIGAAALGTAALVAVGLYKGLNWVCNALSNGLEYVANNGYSRFDEPGSDHDHGAAASLAPVHRHPHPSSSYSSMISSFPVTSASSSVAASAPNQGEGYQPIYPYTQPPSYTTHSLLSHNPAAHQPSTDPQQPYAPRNTLQYE